MKEQSTRTRIIKSAEDQLVACDFADVSMRGKGVFTLDISIRVVINLFFALMTEAGLYKRRYLLSYMYATEVKASYAEKPGPGCRYFSNCTIRLKPSSGTY